MRPDSLAARLRDTLANSWRLKARPDQIAPPGEWSFWLMLAGRGFGKTRSGSEWVHEKVAAGVSRIALVAATAGDVRDVVVEGPSGILATAPRHNRPEYEPSKRRLTWPSGAVATTYSADEPERLRGPEHDLAWADELGAWRYPEAWDQLLFGLRIGRNPQCMITTTPRPGRLIRDLLAREGHGVVVTRGKTRDNAANLAPQFLEAIEKRYGGTRLGRQELDGEYLDDVPGALWLREWIDRDRVAVTPVGLTRIVVAIDPAVSNTENSDETGIVVAGRDAAGHVFVLSDLTGKYGPAEWARTAIRAYVDHHADRVIAEVNNGGALVEATLRTVDPSVSYRQVHASRGKVVRAEPVSALYEQRKVHHVGNFSELEDQLCAFTSDFNRSTAGYSPDRLDALVWAITELAVDVHDVPVAIIGSYTVARFATGGAPIAKAPPPDWYARGDLYPPLDRRWRLEIEAGRVTEIEALEKGWISA